MKSKKILLKFHREHWLYYCKYELCNLISSYNIIWLNIRQWNVPTKYSTFSDIIFKKIFFMYRIENLSLYNTTNSHITYKYRTNRSAICAICNKMSKPVRQVIYLHRNWIVLWLDWYPFLVYKALIRYKKRRCEIEEGAPHVNDFVNGSKCVTYTSGYVSDATIGSEIIKKEENYFNAFSYSRIGTCLRMVVDIVVGATWKYFHFKLLCYYAMWN